MAKFDIKDREAIIPGWETEINNGYSDNCFELRSVVIPQSVKMIWNFGRCPNLTNIEISSSVTYIDPSAFEHCPRLSHISISPDNSIYYSPDGCNAIIERKSEKLILGCQNTIIPPTVKIIGSTAFWGCTGLDSINIPDSVVEIQEEAFRGCKGLEKITIPDSVTKIGENVFHGCSSLTDVELSNKITEIPNSLFSSCTGLKSIGIPNSVKKIGNYAFSECTSLRSIGIGDSVEEIGNYVFQGCTSLSSIAIPNWVKKIGFAFVDCPNMRLVCTKNAKLVDNTGLDSSVKIINPSARKSERETWGKEELDLVIIYGLKYELGRPVDK